MTNKLEGDLRSFAKPVTAGEEVGIVVRHYVGRNAQGDVVQLERVIGAQHFEDSNVALTAAAGRLLVALFAHDAAPKLDESEYQFLTTMDRKLVLDTPELLEFLATLRIDVEVELARKRERGGN